MRNIRWARRSWWRFLIQPVGDTVGTHFASRDLDGRDGRGFDLHPVSRWTGWEMLEVSLR